MRINPDDYKPHEIWQMVMIGKPIKRYPNGYFDTALKNERFKDIFNISAFRSKAGKLMKFPLI